VSSDWDDAKSERRHRDPNRGFDFGYADRIFGGSVSARLAAVTEDEIRQQAREDGDDPDEEPNG
jgi:hypothetical protein